MVKKGNLLQEKIELIFKDTEIIMGFAKIKHGPRVRLSAILIDHEFDYPEAYETSQCPNNCDKCIKACPAHALLNVSWKKGMTRNDIIDITRCTMSPTLSSTT